jgi:hypothetical protein
VSDISRVDAAVLQLRAQLQRLARERSRRASAPDAAVARPLDRLRQARSVTGGGEDEYRRAFVRALLTEELGEGLANQPEFERISNEVWRVLSDDSEMSAMMDEAIERLG